LHRYWCASRVDRPKLCATGSNPFPDLDLCAIDIFHREKWNAVAGNNAAKFQRNSKRRGEDFSPS
jgi:hypothetical protein